MLWVEVAFPDFFRFSRDIEKIGDYKRKGLVRFRIGYGPCLSPLSPSLYSLSLAKKIAIDK